MKRILPALVALLIACTVGYTQTVQPFSQLKNFQQSLAAANLQFSLPKDFKEVKALHKEDLNIDYAMEMPNANFQVWYLVKNLQQEQPRLKTAEENSKRTLNNLDSLYIYTALSTANALAGKDNYTFKNLPPNVLNTFHADKGRSYQLNLYNTPETEHYQYGLLLSLYKNGTGCICMLFLSNENGPDFYKKVNKAYYSVRFN